MPIKKISEEVSTVDIVVGDIPYISKETSEKNSNLTVGKRSTHKDRRKNKQDRRRSVREGILVSLSVKDDKRVLRDRRRVNV